MSEYILNVDDEGAAHQIIDKFGIEETKVYGYSFTGEEIVRCRDCREFTFGDIECATVSWCDYWGTYVESPDGFCAWAERRDA